MPSYECDTCFGMCDGHPVTNRENPCALFSIWIILASYHFLSFNNTRYAWKNDKIIIVPAFLLDFILTLIIVIILLICLITIVLPICIILFVLNILMCCIPVCIGFFCYRRYCNSNSNSEDREREAV